MKQPLKWPGGKHYLAKPIVALMPPHTHYVEPYAGGLAVLLAKPYEGILEVVSDLNRDLTNFWRVLQDESLFRKFRRQVQAIPFSEVEWNEAQTTSGEMSKRSPAQLLAKSSTSRQKQVDQAVRFFILCRQSLAGRCDGFATLSRNRTRRGMNEQVSAWIAAVDGLPEVHARLRRVVVLDRAALEVIRSQDGPDTLFYLDPPYLPETKTSAAFGPLEMTVEQHEELLEVILGVQGKVMISGYASRLYDTKLAGWSRHTFRLPNNAAAGVMKRDMTEIIWCNFQPSTKEEGDAATRPHHGRNPVLI
jgi:DNA adenine methylase